MPRVAEPSAPKYTVTISAPEPGFAEVVGMIRQARAAPQQAVNTALIDLYWRVGGYITQKVESAVWGGGSVWGVTNQGSDCATLTCCIMFVARFPYRELDC